MSDDTPTDNCDNCNKDYDLTVANANLQLFIRTPEMNYIQASCPHCEVWTRMFIGIDTVCSLIEKLPVYVFAEAPDTIKESWQVVFGPRPEDTVTPTNDELPDIPPALRRQLWDWLRSGDEPE